MALWLPASLGGRQGIHSLKGSTQPAVCGSRWMIRPLALAGCGLGTGSTPTLRCCLQASRDTKSTLSRDKVCPQKGQLLYPLDMQPTNSCFLRCGCTAECGGVPRDLLWVSPASAVVAGRLLFLAGPLPLGLLCFWLWSRMVAFSSSASIGKRLLGWEQDSNKQTYGFLLAWLHLWFLPTVPEWMGECFEDWGGKPPPIPLEDFNPLGQLCSLGDGMGLHR